MLCQDAEKDFPPSFSQDDRDAYYQLKFKALNASLHAAKTSTSSKASTSEDTSISEKVNALSQTLGKLETKLTQLISLKTSSLSTRITELDGTIQQDLKGIRGQLEDWKIGIDRQVLELTESIKRDILEEVAGDYVNLDIEDCKIGEPVAVA